MGKVGQSVDESNDDVLHVDCLLHVSTGLQEQVEGLKVELVREHLGGGGGGEGGEEREGGKEREG